jgi:signal transduction histidine kinase
MSASSLAGPGFFRSLSGKVLTLTVLFVMLGEVLIFAPSIANFRMQFLKARIAQAEIAALAAEAAPDRILDDDLRSEILKGAGVTAVALQKGETRKLMLRSSEDISVDQRYDLRDAGFLNQFSDAWQVLFQTKPRIISVLDKPPNMSGDVIEVTMHEVPLRDAMIAFGLRILALSVALSLIVAALVFAALNRLLVKPIRRLSDNMVAFGMRPAEASRVIVPSDRSDEIGMAESELQAMQQQLQGMLQQKAHLASLGLAVSKVSHDLRNMLTSAQLVSDRLAEVKDPTVQRMAPKLFTSLDRAIRFLNETIRYGKAEETPPRRERLNLREMVQDAVEQIPVSARVKLDNQVRSSVMIDADREHLNRVITNLVRNACEALDSGRVAGFAGGLVTIKAYTSEIGTALEVEDNGPGIPPAIKDSLFEAFQSSGRAGGTGLGLAIAAELVHANGGDIQVMSTGAQGTVFRILIPWLAALDGSTVVPLQRLV